VSSNLTASANFSVSLMIVDSGKDGVRVMGAFTVALAHAYSMFIVPHVGAVASCPNC
jgi:hypothetical protein